MPGGRGGATPADPLRRDSGPAALLRRAALYLVRSLDGAVLLALGGLARWLPRSHHRHGGGVCLVTNTLAVGGAQRQILLWLGHRRDTRPVQVVLLTGGGEWQKEVERLGIPLVVMEDELARSRAGRVLLWAFPRAAYCLALAGLFRRARPQVVWSWLFLARVVAAPAARLAGVPRVLSGVRNLSNWKTWPENRHWWYRWADRHAAALSDLVLVNAEALREDYARWAGCPLRKIRVVVNGVPVPPAGGDPGGRRAERQAASLPVVLAVGRLAIEKGHEVLLQASAQLWRAGIPHQLTLVGAGPQETVLRGLAERLGIAGHVVFHGERLDVTQLYRGCDVFALSSRIEGMPNALMEAQARGLPAVTTAAGGATEVVVHGETGLVVPLADVKAFAGALARLLQDPQLRFRMGEAAARRMREVFSVDRMVAGVEEVLAELGIEHHGDGLR